jgi:NAD(P)-dependent dehydrogenase (short-subunit alcohol dehydrogenase family)
LSDVRTAVDEIRNRHSELDALFVNAGLGYAAQRVETEDGMVEHFQVNYLSQFMLTLNLLDLLENSSHGGRVVFNTTEVGELDFDNLQLETGWTFEAGVGLGMVAKHMFYMRLHELYQASSGPRVSCFGFQVPMTVWTNQINIIPFPMKAMATVMRWLGRFISIDECGAMMAPLFVDGPQATTTRSGRFLTWEDGAFVDVGENPASPDPKDWKRLWNRSLELCGDERTRQCAARLLPDV